MVTVVSSAAAAAPEVSADKDSELETAYLGLLHLIERLHRQLLDVIKNELERVGQSDVNAVQALLLYNIGDAELTAGELRSRGHYLGSNVSYNLKKLVDAGYISHQRSKTDRRSVRVSLTDKGNAVRTMLVEMFDRQLGAIEPVGDVHADMMQASAVTLERLERFWGDQIRFRL